MKNTLQKRIKCDKRYKLKEYFRITNNLRLEFSDKYDEALGFIGETKKIRHLLEDKNQ